MVTDDFPALQLLGPQDRLCFQPGRPPSPEDVKDAQYEKHDPLEQVAMLRFELY
jgi:hypothetical protein